MSYSANGDERVTRVLTAIDDLVDALEGTGDPLFGVRVNSAAIRWLSAALEPLGFEVHEIRRTKIEPEKPRKDQLCRSLLDAMMPEQKPPKDAT